MAKGSSSSSPPSPPTFAVFVDSNLDTHLAMVVSPLDTVGDLKRKIGIEHALCFPNMGEITVQAMKVRRRASFYHLSDSMFVRSAFAGIKGTWFLHIDAVSTSSLKQEPRIAKEITSENDLTLTDNQTLRGPLSQKLSVQGDSSLPNAGSCQTPHLQISSSDLVTVNREIEVSNLLNITENDLLDNFGRTASELEKRLDPDVAEMQEPVSKDAAAVGSKLHEGNLVVNEGQKDGREGNYGYLGGGSNDEGASTVIIKKEKSRKRSNELKSNELLESNLQLSIKKKKRKEELDAIFNEPLQDNVKGSTFESNVCGKELSESEKFLPKTSSQDKHKTSPTSSEGLPGKLFNVDFSLPQDPTDDKQKKKKKKKKPSKLHDEVDTAIPSNSCAPHANDSTEMPYTLKEFPDHSLNKTNAAALGQQGTEEICDEALVNNHGNLGKVPGVAESIEECPQKETVENTMELGMTGPSSTEFKDSNRRAKRSSKTRKSNKDLPIQKQAAGVNPEGQLGGDHTVISKQSNVAVIPKESDLKKSAEVDSEVPTNSHHGMKKFKKELPRNVSSKCDPLRSEDQVTEENFDKASKKKSEYLSKESHAMTIVEKDVAQEDPSEVNSEVPFNVDVRNSHRSRRKRSDIAKFSGPLSSTHETGHSSVDQVAEENPNETSRGQHRIPGKDSKEASVSDVVETAALENPAVADSTVPSSPNNKKSRRSKKKSRKTELANQEPIKPESDHSLAKEATNPKAKSGDNYKDLGKESKLAASLGEAAKSPVKLDSVTASNNSGKRQRHSKKNSTKTELFSQSSSNNELDHSTNNHHKDENLEEALGTEKGPGNEYKSTVTPGATAEDMTPAKYSTIDSTGLFSDSSNKNESAHLAAEKGTEENTKILLGETCENSNKEIAQNLLNRGSAEFVEGKDHVEFSKSPMHKINFVDYFVPKEPQHEPVLETETRKANKEKTKRKRKSELSSQDLTAALKNPLGSDKQQILTGKPQDCDIGNEGLVDPLVHLTSHQLKTGKTDNQRTIKSTRKSNMHLEDRSPDVGSPLKTHADEFPGKELQDSDPLSQATMLTDEKGKDANAKNSANSDSKLQSLHGSEGNDIMFSADEVLQYKNFDASVRNNHGSAPVVQNHSISSADVSTKEVMGDLLASSDSTEEETPNQRIRYRVAVRKIPSKSYGKSLNKSDQENITTATIFNDATSGSSEDEFVNNRQTAMKSVSDNSSSSTDSDGELEETRTATTLFNSPGVESNAHGKNDRRTNGGGNILTQSLNQRKNMPLSMILKSTNSYKKAKRTAIQSELEDTESQPVDVVLETQPELASP